MKPSTAILVAGMHRSGTSALAGTLSLLGISLGNRLLDPGPDNPKGYWEHRDVVAVHEQLLASLGSRWDDVRELPSGWLSGGPARRAADAITEIVLRDFRDEPLWAVKDPRICRVLPLWLEVLQHMGIKPVILLMVRDPYEVSSSIAARNEWPPPIGEILWLRYVTEALAASRDVPRSVVTYDDLLADPVAAVTEALQRLGLLWSEPDTQTNERIKQFVDTNDRHHLKATTSDDHSRFGDAAQYVYNAMVKIAEGHDDWLDAARATSNFVREWTRQSDVLAAFGDVIAKMCGRAQALEAQLHQRESDLVAQIKWSEDAQADREALQVENKRLAAQADAQIKLHNEVTARLGMALTEAKADTVRVQARLTQELESAVRKRDVLDKELEVAKANSKSLEAMISTIHASLSWRITRPLRAVSRLLRRKS